MYLLDHTSIIPCSPHDTILLSSVETCAAIKVSEHVGHHHGKIRVPESQRAVISFKISAPSYKLLLHNTGAEQKASLDQRPFCTAPLFLHFFGAVVPA
jgi:hypothetical protein